MTVRWVGVQGGTKANIVLCAFCVLFVFSLPAISRLLPEDFLTFEKFHILDEPNFLLSNLRHFWFFLQINKQNKS